MPHFHMFLVLQDTHNGLEDNSQLYAPLTMGAEILTEYLLCIPISKLPTKNYDNMEIQ